MIASHAGTRNNHVTKSTDASSVSEKVEQDRMLSPPESLNVIVFLLVRYWCVLGEDLISV